MVVFIKAQRILKVLDNTVGNGLYDYTLQLKTHTCLVAKLGGLENRFTFTTLVQTFLYNFLFKKIIHASVLTTQRRTFLIKVSAVFADITLLKVKNTNK